MSEITLQSPSHHSPVSKSPLKLAWDDFIGRPVWAFCLAVVIIIFVIAFLGPIFLDLRPNETSELQYGSPSVDHWLGTDKYGRDLLARTIYGARLSLTVGLVATAISLGIGVVYGLISGYFGGRVDELMMRFVDILFSLPHLVFVIVLIAFLEDPVRSWLNRMNWGMLIPHVRIIFLFIGLGALQWLTMARIVRGQVLALREKEFVMASRALGAGARRLIFVHLLPNVSGPVIVYLTLTIPSVILREAMLSFLGLGIQPPQPSWGSLLQEGAAVISPIRSYWWMIVFPGTVMSVTLLALNFLGDGLREALDPKFRK